MKEKVLKIIGNLLLILGGFYLIFSPSNTFSSIVYVIGLLLVIYGGIIVVYSLIDKDSLTVFGNVLFSGLINILLGIILMVNKNGTIMMLSRLLGVWLIVKSLFSLSLYYGSNIKDKKEIINIGWQKSNLEDIKQAVQNNDCIIINGTKEFIEKAREEVENNLLENKIIEIIDCYDIEDCKYGIKDILDKHDKILNTSGEKNKEEYITTIKVAN